MKRILSISLALLVLVSNVGFSINTHFCDGMAVERSLSIGLHSPDCGMAKMAKGCKSHPDKNVPSESKSCCENKHQVLQMDDNAKIPSIAIGISPLFFAAFVQVFIHPDSFTEQLFFHTFHYSPPLPDKDIQVLFQSFLI